MENKQKIAVIAYSNYTFSGYESTETLQLEKHVTEWVELTTSEIRDLQKALEFLNRNNAYKQGELQHSILYCPKLSSSDEDQKPFILEKIGDYKEYLTKEQAKEDERKKKEEKAKLERKLKKEAKTKEQKLALLEKLKKELDQ